MIVNRQPLYVQIVKEFENRIESDIYEDGSRLPSEPELAEEFGVSRGTLREALGILEKEGYLVREHGKGSFIRKKQKVLAGIEKLEGLTETIRNAGYEAGDEVLDIRYEKLSRAECKMLELKEGSWGYIVESIRTADGIPVIYCYDVLPESVAVSMDKVQERRKYECMSEFLRDGTLHNPVQYVSTVKAVLPEEPINEILRVDERTPLIKISGVMLDLSGLPLNYGVQYFNGDAYQFRLVRK